MIKKNQMLVWQYYKPNKHSYAEKFGYHPLSLLYPFVNESDLYSSTLQEPIVCATVNENKKEFERNIELINTLLSEISIYGQEKHFYDG